jgi:molecular chaperone DnaJ
MPKRDYYEVLGVARDASVEQIKRAYRQLALKYHPDRNPGDATAEERFKEASEAVAVLSDEQKRSIYDRYGHAGLEQLGAVGGGPGGGFGAADFSSIFSQFRDIFGADLFGDFFGGGGGGRRGRREAPQRGSDLRASLEVSLEVAAFGGKEELEVTHPAPCRSCEGTGAAPGARPETCPTCGGRGQVAHHRGAFVLATTCPHCQGEGAVVRERCGTCAGRGEVTVERKVKVAVPAGIEDGQTLRLAEQGQPGTRGGPAGHLYVTVHVAEHPTFRRDGVDLVYDLHLTFPQAALGARVKVPKLGGGEAEVTVPAGTQPGDTLVVPGEGAYRLGSRARGDLVAVVHVSVPKKLSGKARKLLTELADELTPR